MKAKTTISMFLKVDLQHGQDRRCLSEPLLIEMSPIGPSRHIPSPHNLGRFVSKAELNWRAVSAGLVGK